MIRIQWTENGQRHSSWRTDQIIAQRLIIELQERGIVPSVTRLSEREIQEYRRQRHAEPED